MPPDQGCKYCGQTPEFGVLRACSMCHSRLCDSHQFRRGGKIFCDKRCAEEFFFGEPEDGEPGD